MFGTLVRKWRTSSLEWFQVHAIAGAGRELFISAGAVDRRQRLQGGPFVLDERMAVFVHRERDRAVPGQALSDLRLDTGPREVGDERVPQGVEVRHTAGVVAVGDARRFQVGPEHLRRLAPLRHGERRRVGQFLGQVRPQRLGKLTPQRQNVFTAMLAVRGLDRHRRLGAVQVEARSRQARKLAAPQTRLDREPVEQRPVSSGHAEAHSAAMCGSQQPPKLIDGQGPAVVPAVRADV